MKYLKNYQEHNEGFKSNLAKAGIIGSLLFNTPASADDNDKQSDQIELSQDKSTSSIKTQIEELSIERKRVCKDEELNVILDEIKSNINSNDSTKYYELFNRLSIHLSDKYNYKIEPRDINKDEIDAKISSEDFDLIYLLGWLGSICLAICGVPQAWMSFKDKHSDGISWGFLLLWGFGEIFCVGYVYSKLDLPMLMNYSINILIVGIMVYYKVNPTREIENNNKDNENT